MEQFQEPIIFFLIIMTIILVTPILSQRVRLPGIVGIIIGGMLIGPHGLNLIADNDRMVFLSTIGLVYLMFNAGLEVDFNQFMRVRKRAAVFGLLTFSIPQAMGMVLGYFLGLEWLGMILLGSAFASHTLIAFPILTRFGVTRNEAVAITAGATIMTDIGAFLVLAVVLGTSGGQLEASYFLRLFALLAIFAVLVILGLPRLGKIFFKRFVGRDVEFQFVLVVVFISALTAKLIGVHEVVGAFLAGLAVNSTLPRQSPVVGHVLFMGESFFIPMFLLYSGMITDPLTFTKNPATLLIAIGITAVAYISKLLAAWLTSRIFNYSKAEFWTVYGLSHAQAAVTIPTLVIGLQIQLFDDNIFNAAILMILLTSITSPMMVQKFAAGLKQESEIQNLPLFKRILVPISNPATHEFLVSLGSLLAKTCSGVVLALNVVRDERGKENEITHQKELLGRVPGIVSDPDGQIEMIPRLANSYAQGILQTSIERDASMILVGWRGKRSLQQSIFGTVLDEVIWGSDLPVMVGRLRVPINSMRQVVLYLPSNIIAPIAVRRILEAVRTMASALNVPQLLLISGSYFHLVQEITEPFQKEFPCVIKRINGSLRLSEFSAENENDLLVVPGYGSRQRFVARMGGLPESLAAAFEGNLVILHFDR